MTTLFNRSAHSALPDRGGSLEGLSSLMDVWGKPEVERGLEFPQDGRTDGRSVGRTVGWMVGQTVGRLVERLVGRLEAPPWGRPPPGKASVLKVCMMKRSEGVRRGPRGSQEDPLGLLRCPWIVGGHPRESPEGSGRSGCPGNQNVESIKNCIKS